mgnify:CR=1 FL=1
MFKGGRKMGLGRKLTFYTSLCEKMKIINEREKEEILRKLKRTY